jgi:hypothetical protein
MKRLDYYLNKLVSYIIEFIGTPYSLVLHTLLFAGTWGLHFWGVSTSDILIGMTTLVSIEALYLGIMNQIVLNRHTKSLKDVDSHVEELQTEVEVMLDEEK